MSGDHPASVAVTRDLVTLKKISSGFVLAKDVPSIPHTQIWKLEIFFCTPSMKDFEMAAKAVLNDELKF